MSRTKTEPVSTDTLTVTDVTDGQSSGHSSASVSPQVLRLKLKKSEDKEKSADEKKVSFSTETVDNEGLGRKKSKCCCVYHKPHNFDQSSDSEDDSDFESHDCIGHKCVNKSNANSSQT